MVKIAHGGIHGDRQIGMEQLQVAATRGHYLRPLAKTMLALAAEREHDFDRARKLFADLNGEFPANPVFAHELLLLKSRYWSRLNLHRFQPVSGSQGILLRCNLTPPS